ncbi:MAG: hypothetical protein IJ007_06275 [Oscillospiraceae bacterium]|nr:hypothetical protein [Oscillospiraceae bacterium]
MKRKAVIIAAALLLSACAAEKESFSEAVSSDAITVTVSQTTAVSETEITSAETTTPIVETIMETSTETSIEAIPETTATTAEPVLKSEEQLALEALIDERAGGMTAGEICLPVFGDFDKDGINELIAIYGSTDPEWGDTEGEVWFASGNEACMLFNEYRYLEPKVVESQGRYFIKMEACNMSDSFSCYAELKNSAAVKNMSGVALMQGLYPDDIYGDFTYVISNYDDCLDLDDNTAHLTGHTWKGSWAYLDGDDIITYTPVRISEEEFSEYDGSQAVLDFIKSEQGEVGDIHKRGNGIITVNYQIYITESYYDECLKNRFRVLKYRNGAVYDITDKVDFEDRGIYWGEEKDYPRPDFEALSEKLYDSVDGNEYDRINARLCGDFDGDGKDELFAVYGKGGSVGRLYFVDENGAFMLGDEAEWSVPEIISVHGINLIHIERLNVSDSVSYYYQIIDGKPVRIDTYGLMELKPVSENGSEFTAFHTTYDVYTDGTGRSWKPYYFEAINNDGRISFREYYAWQSPAEEISGYIETIHTDTGYDLKPYIEKLSREGEITDLINRFDIGIVHINYMLGDELRYCTLSLDNGTVTDITPENNKGHYVRQVTSKYMLDVIIL